MEHAPLTTRQAVTLSWRQQQPGHGNPTQNGSVEHGREDGAACRSIRHGVAPGSISRIAIIEATSVASAKQAITCIPQTWHNEPRWIQLRINAGGVDHQVGESGPNLLQTRRGAERCNHP